MVIGWYWFNMSIESTDLYPKNTSIPNPVLYILYICGCWQACICSSWVHTWIRINMYLLDKACFCPPQNAPTYNIHWVTGYMNISYRLQNRSTKISQFFLYLDSGLSHISISQTVHAFISNKYRSSNSKH